MKYRIFMTVLLLSVIAVTQSKVRLPNIIGDNMVIQQDSDIKLWGWNDAGKKITVTTSWSKQKYTVKTGRDGKFELRIHSPKASFNPLSIKISDGEDVVLNNILSGEVWVCSGQSNMEMPIKGFPHCPVEGYNSIVTDAVNNKAIRFVRMPWIQSLTPLENTKCQWREVSPATVGDASAVGYFFAQTISKALNIPIGLIQANKGGSSVESWLDRTNFERHTKEYLDSAQLVTKYPAAYMRPMVWYYGTFYPIINYTVKGVLFYQGCSNVGDRGNQYSERLATLASQMRRDFGNSNIPFYIVQIAPFAFRGSEDSDIGARLREQQFIASRNIKNCDIVCTNDLVYKYETKQVHPCQKRQVGERLGYMALSRDYDFKGLIYRSPSFRSMNICRDTCFIQLDNLEGGINRLNDMEGFEIAGKDSIFHKAEASYNRQKGIVIRSDKVKEPVAVRYCFRNFQIGNVANGGGLPLFPFRTDNW